MRKCPKCSYFLNSPEWHCPVCGWESEIIGTLPILAPDLAHRNTYFRASSFTLLAAQEASHFWFRTRNELILWAIGKYASKVVSFMEVGCGTGFVLQGIAQRFPGIHLWGTDVYPEGISFASYRVNQAQFMQMDAMLIPFMNEFDAIGAFDVIEHIDEDEIVLKGMHDALQPGGLLFITVPQHKWLWSLADENACHMRRYTRLELHSKLERAGFTILRSTSFVVSLLPFMYISRLMQQGRREKFNPQAEMQPNLILNRCFEIFMLFDLFLIKMGISFPIGGSRLVIAKKSGRNGS